MEIKGYKLLHELGSGGMATVYLAEHELLQRQVALKVMAPALAADRVFKERFLVEARIVARLAHPNIVAVHDIGFNGESGYIAMEHLPGGSLRERIQAGLSSLAALKILRALAQALVAAHAQGFIHRDIKPQNVLFRADGTPVLTDFGIAKVLAESHTGDLRLTQTGTTLGTAAYMSPEQAQANPIDGRSDIYSLGVLCYEMLTGSLPYQGTDPLNTALKHITEPVPILPQHLRSLQPLINRMMAKHPSQRFASAEALISAIDKCVEGSDTEEQHAIMVSAPSRSEASRSRIPLPTQVRGVPTATRGAVLRNPGLWVLLTVLVVAAGGYGGWYYGQVRSLQQALAQAEAQWVAGKLIQPMGDNAWETLRQVLIQKPEQPDALQLTTQIRAALLKPVYALQAQQQWQAALQALDRALPYQVQPLAAELPALRAELQALLLTEQQTLAEAERRAAQLRELLDQALRLGERKQWVSPPGDNALALYRRILALQPADTRAQQGVEQALRSGLAQIEALPQQDGLRAGQMLSDALAQLPTEPRFLALQAKLQASQAQLRRRSAADPAQTKTPAAQIPVLLKQAQTLERNGRWLNPAEENALLVYRDILQLDPKHAEALAGTERIAAGVKRQIKTKLTQRDPAAALALIKQALAIYPEHAKLQTLLRELQRGSLEEAPAEVTAQPPVTPQTQQPTRAVERPPLRDGPLLRELTRRPPPEDFERRPPPDEFERRPPPRRHPDDNRR
jgi:serine/threonine-protein kinase PpkA